MRGAGKEKETRLPLFEVRVAYLGAFVRLVDLFTRLLFFPIPLFPRVWYILPSPFCKVCVVHSFSQLTHRASDLCSYCPVQGHRFTTVYRSPVRYISPLVGLGWILFIRYPATLPDVCWIERDMCLAIGLRACV